MKQGDYVTRISYGRDVVFKIEKLQGDKAILRGVEYRLLADAPMDDLEIVSDPFAQEHQEGMRSNYDQILEVLKSFRKKMLQQSLRMEIAASERELISPSNYFERPGKVLHLDGDEGYLRKSVECYKALRVPVEGHYVKETNMAEALYRLLPSVRPDIVVITGHDGMYKNSSVHERYKIGNYKNSSNFIQAVKTAREYERNLDSLVIIAGACQSYFEALLHAGANFASSPGRILIHALDPVQVASKMAYASMKESVRMTEIIKHTSSGLQGIGGIETRGCHRLGVPFVQSLVKNN